MKEGKIYTLEELEKKLTKKENLFCHQYIIDFNGSRAAREAGYSKKTCAEIAYENLMKPHIKQYISYIQNDLAKEAGISALSQLLRLKNIAYGNLADLYTDWGKLKEFSELTRDEKLTILEMTHKKTKMGDTDLDVEFVKLKLHSPLEAIREINKMLGFHAPEKSDVSITGDVTGFLPGGFDE